MSVKINGGGKGLKVVKREVSSFVNRLEVLTGWRFVCYKINGHNTPNLKKQTVRICIKIKQQVEEEARSRTRSEQKTSLPSLLSADRLRSLQPSLTTIQT